MKFALIGYGKMGKEIEQIILAQSKNDSIVLKITDENLAQLTIENLKKADVAIEFTRPDAAVSNIKICIEAGVPVVVGTTAWLAHLDEVKTFCTEKNGALLHSPNFSIGVNLFFAANQYLAQLMNKHAEYDLSMEEIHHTEKKDSPSGTAVQLANLIFQENNQKNNYQTIHENESLIENISPETLLITAKRKPDVPGTHTVKYVSGVDEIIFTHEAKSRKGFAEGAVAAARWLVGKKGVFEMKDFLSL